MIERFFTFKQKEKTTTSENHFFDFILKKSMFLPTQFYATYIFESKIYAHMHALKNNVL